MGDVAKVIQFNKRDLKVRTDADAAIASRGQTGGLNRD